MGLAAFGLPPGLIDDGMLGVEEADTAPIGGLAVLANGSISDEMTIAPRPRGFPWFLTSP